MQSILFLIVGIILGIIFQRWRGGGDKVETFDEKPVEEMKEIRKSAKKALSKRTEKRKVKILNFIKKETTHQKELRECEVKNSSSSKKQKVKKGVTSTDIKKMLGVSGGTARKYLNELEKENKIKQVGGVGRGVFYELKNSQK